jgi:hypothetical protein
MSRILTPPETVFIHPARQLRSGAVHLARLDAPAALRLLSGDWQALIGWTREDLEGRPLEEIVHGGAAACRALLGRLVDPRVCDPVAMTVRTKGGGTRELQVYRRFDDYDESVWLACEPLELESAISRFKSNSSDLSSG